jgi:hypothetical protein
MLFEEKLLLECNEGVHGKILRVISAPTLEDNVDEIISIKSSSFFHDYLSPQLLGNEFTVECGEELSQSLASAVSLRAMSVPIEFELISQSFKASGCRMTFSSS